MASTDTQPVELALPQATKPRVGMLGVMQDLYDEMLPGITDRQAAYAEEVRASLAEVADVDAGSPVKDREGIERRIRELEARDVDGLLVVMLTYGPAMRVARALRATRLPVCLANIQPVPEVTARGTWAT